MKRPVIDETKLSEVMEIIEKAASMMEERDFETDKATKKELFELQKRSRRKIVLPEACNSFLIIPTIYEEYYAHMKKENVEMWYLGTYRP